MISNGADKKLFQNVGTLPDMSGAMLNWFQNMVFEHVVKTIVNFVVVETPTKLFFRGVIAPFTAQMLRMKPEGQRAWTWYQVFAEPSLSLVPDDVITYLGVNYRVKQKTDYTQYGYVEYEIILDFVGSGP